MACTGTSGGQSVTYTLDVAAHIVSRAGTGTGAGVDTTSSVYPYAGDRDTPDLQLTTAGTMGERHVSLPDGVVYRKRYAATGGDIWAFPNIHGDTLTTTDTPEIYDPCGNPLAPATGVLDLTTDPTARTGGLTDGWEGAHQRSAEHTGAANWILMGARIYLPGSGQFASTDPVFGGNTNPHTYPTDPINSSDLNGQWSWGAIGNVLSIASSVVAFCPLPVCQAATIGLGLASAGAYALGHDYQGMRGALVATAVNVAIGGFGSVAGVVRGGGRIASAIGRSSAALAKVDRGGVIGHAWSRAIPTVGQWNRRRGLLAATHVLYNSLSLQLSFGR